MSISVLSTHLAWVAAGFVFPYTCQEHCASGHRDPLQRPSPGGRPGRPDREIFRTKCLQLSSTATGLTSNSPLGLATLTGPVLVALLSIFEEESVVRQLGEGWASGNISMLVCVYYVFTNYINMMLSSSKEVVRFYK